MATTELRLSAKKDADGKSQVIVKVTITPRMRPCFKSGVFVSPEWFKPVRETKKGRIYGIVPPKRGRLNVREVIEANEAKSRLDNYVGRILKVCQVQGDLSREAIEEAMTITEGMSIDDISTKSIAEAREAMQTDHSTRLLSFFPMMEHYLEKKQYSYDHEKGFRVLIRDLARYQAFRRETSENKFTLDINTIDKNVIEDFFDYLRNEHELFEEYPKLFARLLKKYPVEVSAKHIRNKIEKRGNNTITKLQKKLKAFFNWLNVKEYTDNQPFRGITIKSEVYGTPYYLTLEERNKIADCDLTGDAALSVQRDIFVFQCLIGCRVGDLMRLTPESIVDGVLEYIPNKTKGEKPRTVRVPLNDRAKSLTDRYAGVDKKGRLFPFISSQKYNEAIKKILTVCGITRLVTILNPTTGEQEQRPINELASSHMARRTFIGNLYKQVKDPNLIGSLSGHTEGSRAFARYREIDDDIKREIVSLID